MNSRKQIEPTLTRLLEKRFFWITMLAAVFIANAIWCGHNRLNGDVAWFLYVIRRLCQGAVLYRDIQDFNPPLVYVFYGAFMRLSSLSGLPIDVAIHGVIWCAVGSVLFLAGQISSVSFSGRGLLLFSIAFAALSLNQPHMPQRDSLCGLLFAGLVISAYLKTSKMGRACSLLCWIVTLLASFALALKPHFLIPWALVTWGLARQLGLRRAVLMKEAWLPLLISVVSWIVTFITLPAYFSVAVLASHYYDGMNARGWAYFPLIFPMSVAALAFWRKAHSPLGSLIYLCALTLLGFVIECALQQKMFPYHLVPCIFWSVITVALLIVDVWESESVQTMPVQPICAILATIVLAAYSFWSATRAPYMETTRVDTFIREHGKGKKILTLATHPWVAFPLLFEAGATNALTGSVQWMLGSMYRDEVRLSTLSPEPLVARYHTRPEMAEDERRLFDEVLRVMTVNPANFIIVETVRWKWGLKRLQFDFVDYFSSDASFRAALQSYRAGPSDAFRLVLIRKDRQDDRK